MNKQRELAELLWAAEETKQAYKNLYNETEILLQAEFNKSFGNINTTPIYRPQNLIDYAGITKDVVVIGVSSRVEIWDKAKWENYTSEENMDVNEIAIQMSNLGI